MTRSPSWFFGAPPVPPKLRRTGIVRPDGRALRDDQGYKHFLTTTLMWSVFGYEFERDRWLKNIRFAREQGCDGIRTLGSVMGKSWTGRQIDPTRPTYETALAGQIDTAFDEGLRQMPFTMLGDHFTDVHAATDKMIHVLRGREEKIGYIEIANEWGHAVKISKDDLMRIGIKVRAAFPNMLLALSRPQDGGADTMKAMMKVVGGPLIFPRHTDREEADRNWRQARQPYDFAGDEWSSSNQEPPGPASSVGELWKPRQLGAMRWLSHASGCGVFCHHTGNGVRGNEDQANNRQPNLWEINGIVKQFAALNMVTQWLPDGVQNWKVINNGRDTGPEPHHPLQLPDGLGDGFWEGGGDVEAGDVNKNYAVVHPNGKDFMVGLFGLNEGTNRPPFFERRRSGQALKHMRVKVFDSLTGDVVEDREIAAGQWLALLGRRDREMSYIIRGTYL